MTPEFIVELRRHIGHAPLWLPGVTAIVLNRSKKKVLLVRRSDNGDWTPVTGICDPGEHAHLAAIRETLEETGVSISIDRLLWVQAVGPVEYANGDVASYMDTAFVCSVLPESAPAHVADDENSEVAWFFVDKLPPMKERFTALVQHALSGGQGWG